VGAVINATNAVCVLCKIPLIPDEPYIMVYKSAAEDTRLAHADQREGFMHLRHLLRLFEPGGIMIMPQPQQAPPPLPDIRVVW
jgi:hypothetical protein